MSHRPPRRSSPRRRLAFDTLSTRVLMTAHVARRLGPSLVRETMSAERNVVYRNEPESLQTLDLYRGAGPAPEGGRPVLVAIHGGGWTRFDKSLYGRQIARFTRQGFLVVAPNYRLSRPGRPSWPTNLEDVREAIRWIRRNAEQLGVDPARIAAIGESAGGHLAELLGTKTDSADSSTNETFVSSRVDAVVAFAGPSNLATLQARSPSAASRARRFLGATPRQEPERYAQASPLANVSSDDAPMFLVHGSADTVVPVSQSIALANRLRSQGVATRLVVIPGGPHEIRVNEPGRHLSRSIVRFLRKVMP